MELVVGKNALLRELQLFQGIVERKNTIPILANVLMEAKGNEVRMLATDLEVALRSRCDATVAKGGALTLPAKKLYEIVKALPETDVRIEEDKNGVKVRRIVSIRGCRRSRAKTSRRCRMRAERLERRCRARRCGR
jgi:DNA polymerase-3 subunit beta